MKIEAKPQNYIKASITVEASLAVPVFFLAFMAFMYLFEGISMQKQMQAKLAEAGRNYAATGIQIPLVTLEQGGMQRLQWEIGESESYCSVTVCRMIPGIPSQLLPLNLYQNVRLSPYTGRTMIPEPAEDDSEYVYLAANGSVYHRKIDCTYLKLGIMCVTGSRVGELRNQSGGKYKACEACMEGGEADSFQSVYITPYGARYHRIRDCSGLRRTVRKVKLSEVGAMPPCSKCGSAAK